MTNFFDVCCIGDDDTTTASSQSSVGRDSSLGHELEATSTKVKGVAPPPLDLGIGEGEEHVVPSQSDVMDILSVASKGANDVTAENLKQVYTCVCKAWYTLVEEVAMACNDSVDFSSLRFCEPMI